MGFTPATAMRDVPSAEEVNTRLTSASLPTSSAVSSGVRSSASGRAERSRSRVHSNRLLQPSSRLRAASSTSRLGAPGCHTSNGTLAVRLELARVMSTDAAPPAVADAAAATAARSNLGAGGQPPPAPTQ